MMRSAFRDILLEKEGNNTNFLSYRIPYNESFNVVYTLSNKGKKDLKGEIKAVWEREFKLKSNSYRPGTKKQIIGMMCLAAMMSSCHIYKAYDRPETIDASGVHLPFYSLYPVGQQFLLQSVHHHVPIAYSQELQKNQQVTDSMYQLIQQFFHRLLLIRLILIQIIL